MKESNHSAGYAAFFPSARTQHSRIAPLFSAVVKEKAANSGILGH
jgi:hypothetical protein